MKTMLPLIATLCFGVLVNAKEPEFNTGSVHQIELTKEGRTKIKKRFPKKGNTARLYLFKNSRVKKALAFRTKANKAKLV